MIPLKNLLQSNPRFYRDLRFSKAFMGYGRGDLIPLIEVVPVDSNIGGLIPVDQIRLLKWNP